MEEDYQKSLELIFAYGYGCSAFKHSICGDQPGIPDGIPDSADQLPLEFFVNPRCPRGPNSRRGQGSRDRFGRGSEGSRGGCHCKGTRLTSFPISVILGDSCKGRSVSTSARIIIIIIFVILGAF